MSISDLDTGPGGPDSITGLKHSMTHPRYLHSNSTSHNWPFSAIAELIDNAVDAGARRFDITVEQRERVGTTLIFRDDGHGMASKELLKMMSFGHCDKKDLIGHYGNGFKSGSMRLGTEAMVLTRDRKGVMSVGLLSQTFLKDVAAEEVLVPLVETRDARVLPPSADLAHILKYGPCASPPLLTAELLKLPATGTRIMIYSLRSHRKPEFDFDSDPHDIRLRCDDEDADDGKRPGYPEYSSLRSYLEVLYLHSNMIVYLRGSKVRPLRLPASLLFPRRAYYSPRDCKRIRVTLGYNPRGFEHYGMMFYHRHRLIRMYHRVGTQLGVNSVSKGVVGIVELPALEVQPTHNKQDLLPCKILDNLYRQLPLLLSQYVKVANVKEMYGSLGDFFANYDSLRALGPFFVQCANCGRWRQVDKPASELPDDWVCSMSTFGSVRTCLVKEEDFPIDELRAANTDEDLRRITDPQKRAEMQLEKAQKAVERRAAKLQRLDETRSALAEEAESSPQWEESVDGSEQADGSAEAEEEEEKRKDHKPKPRRTQSTRSDVADREAEAVSTVLEAPPMTDDALQEEEAMRRVGLGLRSRKRKDEPEEPGWADFLLSEGPGKTKDTEKDRGPPRQRLKRSLPAPAELPSFRKRPAPAPATTSAPPVTPLSGRPKAAAPEPPGAADSSETRNHRQKREAPPSPSPSTAQAEEEMRELQKESKKLEQTNRRLQQEADAIRREREELRQTKDALLEDLAKATQRRDLLEPKLNRLRRALSRGTGTSTSLAERKPAAEDTARDPVRPVSVGVAAPEIPTFL